MTSNRSPSRRTVRALLAGTAITSCALGVAIDHTAFAQSQQPSIKRTELLRTDVPTGAQYVAVEAIAEIPAGGTSGRHRHPGIEVGYILDGAMTLEREGQRTVTLKAGDAFKNEGVIHKATNNGAKPVKILGVYIVEKGKPLAEPVP